MATVINASKKAYLKAKNQNRSLLIHGHKVPKVNTGVRLINRFSGQHRQVRDIMQKYWYLLIKDYPEITYKRSWSLKDNFVHSHYAPKSAILNKAKGTRPCHKRNFCRYIHSSSHVTLPDGRQHKPKFSATCLSIV